MLTRFRSTWLAGGGAMLLALSLSGVAAGAVLVADDAETVVQPVEPAEGTTSTTLTFEDTDGNGVDDDCQAAPVEANPAAVLAALSAVDLDGDGRISVSEAAQSDWTGGTNCNHGGYVSSVAHGSDEEVDEETNAEDPAAADCPAVVEPVPAPAVETPVDTSRNAHGKAVSEVAHSDAVGGKNCNHGGAVSEAAKKDHAAKQDHAAKNGHADRSSRNRGKGHNAQD